MKRNLVGGFLSIALAFLVVKPTFAHHQQQVLGVATISADTLQNLQIPSTSEGPGLILPDSPLFFLDQLKQEFRLFLVFTPEAKAKIHASIAGERMAELRFMVQKNSKRGIEYLCGEVENLPFVDYQTPEKIAIDKEGGILGNKEIGLISKLNPIQMDVLYLRYFENLSYQNIADRLNLTFSTVSDKLLQAKNALRRLLKEKGYVHTY